MNRILALFRHSSTKAVRDLLCRQPSATNLYSIFNIRYSMLLYFTNGLWLHGFRYPTPWIIALLIVDPPLCPPKDVCVPAGWLTLPGNWIRQNGSRWPSVPPTSRSWSITAMLRKPTLRWGTCEPWSFSTWTPVTGMRSETHLLPVQLERTVQFLSSSCSHLFQYR